MQMRQSEESMRLAPEQVGQRIREARLARGWTHEQLARRMDVNWRTVQRWQKGNLPRLPKLVQLADVLGVPQGYFVEAEDSVATLNDLRARIDDLAAHVDALALALASLAPAPPDEPQDSPGPQHRSTP
jgi:transcriptional regulator with XRE-family HTH domain